MQALRFARTGALVVDRASYVTDHSLTLTQPRFQLR